MQPVHSVSELSAYMCIFQKTISLLFSVKPYLVIDLRTYVVALFSGQSIIQFFDYYDALQYAEMNWDGLWDFTMSGDIRQLDRK